MDDCCLKPQKPAEHRQIMEGFCPMLQLADNAAGKVTHGDGSSTMIMAALPARHAALLEALAMLGLEQVHCLLLHLHDGRWAC